MSKEALSEVFLIQGPVAWDSVIKLQEDEVKSVPSEIHGQSKARGASELFYWV